MASPPYFTAACPIPITDYPRILMAHGGGGTLSQQLLDQMFLPAFTSPGLAQAHDGAALSVGEQAIAFTTDSFVVKPIFFPGGDIGSLAVYGTANDLAMCGARPTWMSAAFILEEGLPMDALWNVIQSMQAAAAQAGVQFVTGDTKVVDKGKGDQLFVNTAGIGLVDPGREIRPSAVRPGDKVLLSGDVGRHGMAIMSVREGLAFDTPIESDCAPLWPAVNALFEAGIEVHCLRDLTRGGLSSGLNEIATGAGLQIDLEEGLIPVSDQVRGACEILGLDPLYVANEGRFAIFVKGTEAEQALAAVRRIDVAAQAVAIGEVTQGIPGRVTLKSRIGSRRILDRLSGEQLPRIC